MCVCVFFMLCGVYCVLCVSCDIVVVCVVLLYRIALLLYMLECMCCSVCRVWKYSVDVRVLWSVCLYCVLFIFFTLFFVCYYAMYDIIAYRRLLLSIFSARYMTLPRVTALQYWKISLV